MNFFDTPSSVWQCYGKSAKTIMNKRALIFCFGVAFAASLLTSLAADKKAVDVSKIPPASDKTGVTYAADIKPIFEKSCVKCHGAEKQKGKLRLDTLAAAPTAITRGMFPAGAAGDYTFQQAINTYGANFTLREPRKTFRFTVATTF